MENIEKNNDFKFKTNGFDKPTVFLNFTKLAEATKSVNLGHGFPDWQPPKMFLDNLQKHLTSGTGNFQYTNTKGIPRLREAIAKNYETAYKRKICSEKEVLVTNGAVNPLYTLFNVFLDKGYEAITLEPFYDCYYPQTKFVGASLVGVPLIPPPKRNKSEYEDLSKWKEGDFDEWKVDFEKLQSALNSKTRLLVLNTPNNPTGKILSYDELKRIAKMLEAFPDVIVVMDEVYEYNIFGKDETLPRMSTIPGMWDRTITIHSAGKIFSVTGTRVGWVIGSSWIINRIFPICQNTALCIFEPFQQALADCLEVSNKPYEGFESYFKWVRNQYGLCRNTLIEGLAKNKSLDIDLFLPEGGFFLICDISKHNPETKHQLEGDTKETVEKYTKDYKFLLNLAHDKGVVAIPCSALFTPENRHIGQNYIRFAFCKNIDTMKKAFTNLAQEDRMVSKF